MSWDPLPKCCHTAQQSIPEQPVVTGKMAATASQREQQQGKRSRWSDMRRGEGREKMNREGCFQFPEDTPNIIKESAGQVTPNQTLTTFPTHSSHLLCTLHRQCEYFHLTQMQAYSLKGRGEERFCFRHRTPRHLNHYSSEKKQASEFININYGS